MLELTLHMSYLKNLRSRFLSFQDDMILTGSSLRPDGPIKAFKELQMDKDGSDFEWSYAGNLT